MNTGNTVTSCIPVRETVNKNIKKGTHYIISGTDKCYEENKAELGANKWELWLF